MTMLARLPSRMIVLGAFAVLAACGPSPEAPSPTENRVSIRNLAETSTSAPARASYTIKGQLVATPSDPRSRYYVLFQKEVLFAKTIIAVLRQERGGRIAYARVELDCRKRLFHVVGVGNRRSFAETDIAHDGPLRSLEGLPLRQELATHICRTNGTPLAVA